MAEAVHSIADELKKLHELLESGVISKEDFERAKKKMIEGVSAQVDEPDSGSSQPSDVQALDATSPEVSESGENNLLAEVALKIIVFVIVFELLSWWIGGSHLWEVGGR